jgi:Mn-dependent DtxR family transcriptional regulator
MLLSPTATSADLPDPAGKRQVVCAELAARLQVSEHTIRRDLHELSREGL